MSATEQKEKKIPYEKPVLVRHDELQETINPYGPRLKEEEKPKN